MKRSRLLKQGQNAFKRITRPFRRLCNVGAFAIILDEQRRVLLCHRCDADLWNLPGGHVEWGETPGQAVIREVNEETGFEVVVQSLVGIYVNPARRNVAFSFVCHITGGTMTTSDESDAIAYFPFEEIPRYTSPYHRARIQDVLETPAHFHLKFQHGPSAKKLLHQGKL
jgi:8-oxo-dGTP diphosphatase